MSMLMIKIMSAENKPDDDVTKCFKAIAIGPGDSFEFDRLPFNGVRHLGNIGSDEDIPPAPTQAVVKIVRAAEPGVADIVELTGNAYVVSETGKTVASFSYSDVKLSRTPPRKP